MQKISDTTVKDRLDMLNDAFYKWKKRDPEAVRLIKKGLVAERVLNKQIFEEMIKAENKKREVK